MPLVTLAIWLMILAGQHGGRYDLVLRHACDAHAYAAALPFPCPEQLAAHVGCSSKRGLTTKDTVSGCPACVACCFVACYDGISLRAMHIAPTTVSPRGPLRHPCVQGRGTSAERGLFGKQARCTGVQSGCM